MLTALDNDRYVGKWKDLAARLIDFAALRVVLTRMTTTPEVLRIDLRAATVRIAQAL
jgi:hypothetical protein